MFTKSDLKIGMLIQTRKGDYYVVMPSTIEEGELILLGRNIIPVSNMLRDDLTFASDTNKSDNDIMKVWDCSDNIEINNLLRPKGNPIYIREEENKIGWYKVTKSLCSCNGSGDYLKLNEGDTIYLDKFDKEKDGIYGPHHLSVPSDCIEKVDYASKETEINVGDIVILNDGKVFMVTYDTYEDRTGNRILCLCSPSLGKEILINECSEDIVFFIKTGK